MCASLMLHFKNPWLDELKSQVSMEHVEIPAKKQTTNNCQFYCCQNWKHDSKTATNYLTKLEHHLVGVFLYINNTLIF